MSYKPNEDDWELLKLLAIFWQQHYMARKLKEYYDLCGDVYQPVSKRFNELVERIKVDSKSVGARVSLCRKDIVYVIMQFLNEKIITVDDLTDFSEELQNEIKSVISRR